MKNKHPIDKLKKYLSVNPETGLPNGFSLDNYPHMAYDFAYRFDREFSKRVIEDFVNADQGTKQQFIDNFERLQHEDYRKLSEEEIRQRVDLANQLMKIPYEEIKRRGLEWLATQGNGDIKEKLKEEVIKNLHNGFNFPSHIVHEQPAYETLGFKEDCNNRWVIHYTPHARAIANEGFKYGVPTVKGMTSTRGGNNFKVRKQKQPGYNFGFDALNIPRHFENYGLARNGKGAIVCFVPRGIKTHHNGDREEQVIFWGPEIDKDMIFPLVTYSKSDVEELEHWKKAVNNDKRKFNGGGSYVPLDEDAQLHFEDQDSAIKYILENHEKIQAKKTKNGGKFKEFPNPQTVYSYERPAVDTMKKMMKAA